MTKAQVSSVTKAQIHRLKTPSDCGTGGKEKGSLIISMLTNMKSLRGGVAETASVKRASKPKNAFGLTVGHENTV